MKIKEKNIEIISPENLCFKCRLDKYNTHWRIFYKKRICNDCYNQKDFGKYIIKLKVEEEKK